MKKIASILALALCASPVISEESIDASDPTKIYSYVGPGYKYTEYSNGDNLQEARVIGNLGLGNSDMVLFEIGYGTYNGTLAEGEKEDGTTNGRARWFHLFNMDYSVLSGYRGLATQIDLQFEGSVKGTKGSNTVALGAMPAFGINENWSFFLPINYVSTWGEDFKDHQGHGISIAPMASYAPAEGLWPGFFLQLWPSYTRYVSGDLEGEGGANLDVTVGGSITQKILVTGTFQQNFDKDLKLFNPSTGSSGPNDWNIFLAVNFYF
ncbi:MAG: hypothetical protein V7711_08355 [Pseudomonadales bacterium]